MGRRRKSPLPEALCEDENDNQPTVRRSGRSTQGQGGAVKQLEKVGEAVSQTSKKKCAKVSDHIAADTPMNPMAPAALEKPRWNVKSKKPPASASPALVAEAAAPEPTAAIQPKMHHASQGSRFGFKSSEAVDQGQQGSKKKDSPACPPLPSCPVTPPARPATPPTRLAAPLHPAACPAACPAARPACPATPPALPATPPARLAAPPRPTARPARPDTPPALPATPPACSAAPPHPAARPARPAAPPTHPAVIVQRSHAGQWTADAVEETDTDRSDQDDADEAMRSGDGGEEEGMRSGAGEEEQEEGMQSGVEEEGMHLGGGGEEEVADQENTSIHDWAQGMYEGEDGGDDGEQEMIGNNSEESDDDDIPRPPVRRHYNTNRNTRQRTSSPERGEGTYRDFTPDLDDILQHDPGNFDVAGTQYDQMDDDVYPLDENQEFQDENVWDRGSPSVDDWRRRKDREDHKDSRARCHVTTHAPSVDDEVMSLDVPESPVPAPHNKKKCSKHRPGSPDTNQPSSGSETPVIKRSRYSKTSKNDIVPVPSQISFYLPCWRQLLEEAKAEMHLHASIVDPWPKLEVTIDGVCTEILRQKLLDWTSTNRPLERGFFPEYQSGMKCLLYDDLTMFQTEMKKSAKTSCRSGYPLFPKKVLPKKQHTEFVKKGSARAAAQDENHRTDNFGAAPIRDGCISFYYANTRKSLKHTVEFRKTIPPEAVATYATAVKCVLHGYAEHRTDTKGPSFNGDRYRDELAHNKHLLSKVMKHEYHGPKTRRLLREWAQIGFNGARSSSDSSDYGGDNSDEEIVMD
ncbi:hypothetical protein BV22DRAFT_1052111 [Leucogyrophana mollusca]|uniref:Uncharacterized protein n=1 Tax=Leucogyrophana mollusca TaxID=85980 RepID=A0ACB8AWX9_9AGAM|nr:hypothetical protein BV22DRAFT_1052111 [Leucogyrophana mollusca]